MKTLRFLLENLIDYAGLFPPAELAMAEAVRNYATYRQSEHSWMLGKFIVPAARLEEFEQAAAKFWPRDGEEGFWKLSTLGGANLNNDLAQITRFSRRHSFGEQAAGVMIDTIEFKASTVEEIQAAMRVMVRNGDRFVRMRVIVSMIVHVAVVVGVVLVRVRVVPVLFCEELGRRHAGTQDARGGDRRTVQGEAPERAAQLL